MGSKREKNNADPMKIDFSLNPKLKNTMSESL
jgi:hypothetical protein